MSKPNNSNAIPSGTGEVVKRPAGMADAFLTAMVRNGMVPAGQSIMLPTIREAAWGVQRKA
jgi:hypothetical protein